ncbi:MAG: hypothetical protein MK212_11935 [Saprospiraceae bacterium]|nr:hypothetical protein [Saprospiraceae bacterium]
MCECQKEELQVAVCNDCGQTKQHCKCETMEARERLWDIILVLMVIAYVLTIVRLIAILFGSKTAKTA